MKIKKIQGIYPASIAAAVKDANFRREDGSVMTQGEINQLFSDDSIDARIERAEMLLNGMEAEITIKMQSSYGDTSVIALECEANNLVLGDIAWSCSLGSDTAEINDGVLVFKKHYVGSVTVNAVTGNASASHTFTVSCDEVAESVTYTVSNIRMQYTEVDADVTSMVVYYTGNTVSRYPMKGDETSSQNLSKTVTFSANDTFDEVTRSGSFSWNGQTVNWSVKQNGLPRVQITVHPEVGRILCSDMSVVIPDIADDGVTVNSVNLNGKTPIGICVVPGEHMDDGKARWMSLDWMSCGSPESGSQSKQYIETYKTSTISGYNSIPTYGSISKVFTEYFDWDYEVYIQYHMNTDGLYYNNPWGSASYESCPYLPDGSINPEFKTSSRTFDGKGNTDKIINVVTADWQTGTISNSNSTGNYPAACCCRRYHTAGTNAGDWYLPTIDELCYLSYDLGLIINILTKLNKSTFDKSDKLQSSSFIGKVAISHSYVFETLGSVAPSNDSQHLVRAFLAYDPYDYVDLGLPSGLLWAKCNVGATQPHEDGLYFQWGALTGHAQGSDYNFSSDNYPESGISADLSISQDSARENMGGTWRMPTWTEFAELADNCTSEWTSQSGVNGRLFISKVNGKSIFFPASGNYNGTSLDNRGSRGYYWSRTFGGIDARTLYFESSYMAATILNVGRVYHGHTIRAVKSKNS